MRLTAFATALCLAAGPLAAQDGGAEPPRRITVATGVAEAEAVPTSRP